MREYDKYILQINKRVVKQEFEKMHSVINAQYL